MASIGIIGWGVVGQATGRGFERAHSVLWHDPHKEGGVDLDTLVLKSEFLFVCVPTPMFSDYSGIDLSIVEEVVVQLVREIGAAFARGSGEPKESKVIVIKSTVVPGTTARLQKQYPELTLVCNPEFLTESKPFEDFLSPDRTILGGDLSASERVRALYGEILPENSVYFLTDSTSAELAKYMSNTILAAKVMLANEYYSLAEKLGVDYDLVRVMVEADPRIGSHIRVPGHDGDLGFGGKCLPKDLVALLSVGRDLGVKLPLLEQAWKENLKVRKNKDWETISGAVSKKD